MNKDLYAILGVDRSADDKKLKSAYRKLAKKYHPDANPGDKDAEQKFKDVGEAYTVMRHLTEPAARQAVQEQEVPEVTSTTAAAETDISPSISADRTRRICSEACSAIFSAAARADRAMAAADTQAVPVLADSGSEISVMMHLPAEAAGRRPAGSPLI